MTTIPASAIVRINPSVLGAGGSGLDLLTVALTENMRIPIGQVARFSSAADVSAYFGPASFEAAQAPIYFNGFTISTIKPSALLMASYPATGAAAFLRGGKVSTLTIPQLQAITGTLSIVVDGVARTVASLNLSSATSYSAAAALIATALNTSPPSEVTFTGSIAAGTASVTASIAGSVMYVTAVGSGVLWAGSVLSGTGVTSGTAISKQLSGITGGIGAYAVTKSQVVASTTVTSTFGTLTATGTPTGTISVGQTITGGTTAANTVVTALNSGTGGAGTYIVNLTQVVTSGALVGSGTNVTVTYDTVSGSLVASSGITGAPSTIAYMTGTAAASLFLTAATGAVVSQGADATLPGPFMDSIAAVTQNWANVLTLFDPDGGSGHAQKDLFSAWTNAQNNRFGYLAWDTDPLPATVVPATQSFGYALQQSDSSGTAPIWVSPSVSGNTSDIAMFLGGVAASIDYGRTNGRITVAFKSQSGLVADVTNQTAAANLGGNPQAQQGDYGNGYNFYGAYATANDQFVFANRGVVSGPFQWLDTYWDQIWLNNALQLALVNLLVSVNSIPYNDQGYGLIRAACLDPINSGLRNGVIRAGVTLSSAQRAEINNLAGGVDAASAVQTNGWYLLIQDALPIVRQNRASPPITLWYTDGESVQAINMASIAVL